MKVFVAGASGVLGSALLGRLRARGHEAWGVSRRKSADGTLDLSDAAAVDAAAARGGWDLAVNCAAFSDVDGCERDPDAAWASNALAVRNLAAACGPRGIPLLHVSTDYVFNGRKNSPYEETDEPFPVNVYGLSKLAGEAYARRCASPAAIVRTSWLFGAGNPQNFVNAIAERLRKEPVVRVLDDQVDAPTSAADLADALEVVGVWLAGSRGGFRGLYQFRNAGVATRLEMARAMKEMMAAPAAVERLDARELKGRLAVRPPVCVMSSARFEADFGRSIRPWREALAEYLRGAA